MIPNSIRNNLKEVNKLRVENSADDNYRFDCETDTLFIPLSEQNFARQFKDFINLKEIELNIHNKVKYAHAMFYQCINLKKIIFTKKLNLEYVCDLSYLFYNCSSLTKIDLSNVIIGDSPLFLNNMFYNCTSIKMINFGNNFHNKQVHFASYLFYNCKMLKRLDLRGIYFTNIEKSCNMFSGTDKDLEVLVNNTFSEELV